VRYTVQTLRALVLMSRPLILLAALPAFGLGVALAVREGRAIVWPTLLLALALTLLANLSAHFADEFGDADTDRLARPSGVSGGSGAMALGLATPGLALAAAGWSAALCGLLGLWAVALDALPPICGAYLALGLVGGWAYSVPPLALERRGLGELLNAALGGLLLPLMGYAAVAGVPHPALLLALLPTVAAVLLNLVDVHWADREADAAVDKRTLAVIFGPRLCLLQWLWLLLAYGLPLLLAVFGVLPWPVAWATLATLPLGLLAAWRFDRGDPPLTGPVAMLAHMLAQIVGGLSV
jgi:1,4-dihydroxy-2-naphthoate octaprenyltransferase